MKQIWPNYSYSPTTNVLTLTGLNIDRDQLLWVSAPERGRIMYNFADSTVTASAFTAGANTGLTLVASTAGLTTTAALVIYYDDQLQSTAITISNFPASQATTFGAVTGSVSVLNFPATQAVSLASVPTHGVTLVSTTVTVSALPRPTWTNYSGTIVTANTSITAISTTTRSYLLAQVTTGQLFINIGATATSMNSVYFSAGQGFAWETSVPQGIVSIISGVTASNYVLKEG